MAFWPRRPRIDELVREHYRDLYRFAYRLTGRQADAEDLTQETFYRAQGALPRLRDPRKAKAWLFKILHNLHRQGRRQGASRTHLPWTEVEDEFPLPSEAVTRNLRDERLREAVLQVEELYRTPLILFYFGSFSYREIGDILEVPPGTVMSRLARGKSALRRLLAGQGLGSASDLMSSLGPDSSPHPPQRRPGHRRPEQHRKDES